MRDSELMRRVLVAVCACGGLGLGGCGSSPEAHSDSNDPPAELMRERETDPGERAGAEGDPFAGIEGLRPEASAGWPLENIDPSRYAGWRIDPISGAFEQVQGMRFVSQRQDFVLAIAQGRVAHSAEDEEGSLTVRVDHGDGISTHYGPLSALLAPVGVPLDRGAAIGLCAGQSLQLRVSVDGVDIDPLLAIRQPLHRWPGLIRTPPPAPVPMPAPVPIPSD